MLTLTQDNHTDTKTQLLQSVLPHVAFDGWSETAFFAACNDLEIDLSLARLVCPRGPLDLAVYFHMSGDTEMLELMNENDFSTMRFRDKVAASVRFRLEAVEDKEAVRRGATLFALPQNAALGARLIWGTADAIWTGLGDSSTDVNWYTKRATLSAVYGSCMLFWLGDDSPDHASTWGFLDRRIENVMQVEKVKSKVRESAPLQQLLSGPNWLLSKIRSPQSKTWNNS
jgi:ubiquinone biosynthesis protein COQ9